MQCNAMQCNAMQCNASTGRQEPVQALQALSLSGSDWPVRVSATSQPDDDYDHPVMAITVLEWAMISHFNDHLTHRRCDGFDDVAVPNWDLTVSHLLL